MPNTISVSPAQPDKLVVNGCDLLNRAELSQSQNRELQRYIDANAHLLGFFDKQKDENNESLDHSKYNSLGRFSTLSAPVSDRNSEMNAADNRSSYFYSNMSNSPAPSDSSRRKGVSWVDNHQSQQNRARSHSPKGGQGSEFAKSVTPISMQSSGREPEFNTNYADRNYGNFNDSRYSTLSSNTGTPYSPSYSTTDRRKPTYDYGYGLQNQQPKRMTQRTESPWSNSSITSRESRSREQRGDGGKDWKGFPTPIIPVYSSLERHPDDYNRFDTHRYREIQSRSQERDDTMKFYGFGDHRVSGIELQAKRWTGGELVTDPTILKKSLKPRRTYYSPIGDGVVEADGVEMKRGPKDMTPYVEIRHERYVEGGSPGRIGRRLLEEKWSEGGGGNDDDGNKKENRGSPYDGSRRPPYDGNRGRGPLYDGQPKNRKPTNDDDPYKKAQSPLGNDDSLKRPPKNAHPASQDGDNGFRSPSALSIGTDGMPREGWTKTFIVNPRELINQYGNETQTIIFDLENHTPKTTTTTKERISYSPAPSRR